MILRKIFKKEFLPMPVSITGNEVKIEVRKQNKSLRLRIDAISGQPILSIPPYATQRQINSFLQKSEGWIQKNARSQSIEQPQRHIFIDGIKVEICRDTFHKRATLDWNSNKLHLPQTLKHPDKSLQALLKPLAHRKLTEVSAELSSTLHVRFNSLEVREYKSRWGSCSHAGQLSYSWRLILAPPEILRYVCAHEVSHLIHMDHSRQFWNTVALVDPDYRIHRKWLKDKGTSLFFHILSH